MTKIAEYFLLLALLVASARNSLSNELHPSELDEQAKIIKATDDKPKAGSEYRLPNSVIPSAYDIKLTAIDFKKFTFTGTISIDARVLKVTKKVLLHAGNITVQPAAFNEIPDSGTPVHKKIKEVYKNDTTDILTIELTENLKANTDINFNLNFNGTLRDDMIGFYRSSYHDATDKESWLAATQFESTHARHAFPCFDEPAFRAKFNISILLPEGYDCLSNMPKTNQTLSGWCRLQESVPMSTYLVAFTVFKFVSLPNDNSSFQAWSRPNAISQAQYGLDVGRKALSYFANLFDEPYALGKMDMVAVPDFSAGAMENWGLMTFRETAMLYDERDSSDAAKQRVGSVIVHECTHMWFGNLVTPDWWSYLWLSEAFARYYQYMATAEIEKSWKMDEQFVVEQHQQALRIDALETSKPMTREAVTQAEIGEMGDAITYSKGASIVRMMEKMLGPDIFNAALKQYLKNRKYQTAKPSDLWAAFQNQIDKQGTNKDPIFKDQSISSIMKAWTEEAGFPYITVNITSDFITLSQDRFLIRKTNDVPTSPPWVVPITWLTSEEVINGATSSKKPVYWLTGRNSNFTNPSKDAKWMIFNVNSAGFYRVNYDVDSWNKIIKVLNSRDFEKIPVLNRAAIVDDLLNLARAEKLPYEIALRGIQYLRRETNYLPFKSLFTSLDYLIQKFSTSSDNDLFKEFVTSLFNILYEKLTYKDDEKDDHFKILLRQEINHRACSFDHPECVVESKKQFSDWRINHKTVPKNQRSTAYCTAIKYGSKEEWDFLRNQYRIVNVAAEQLTILQGLSCSENPEFLREYLLDVLKGYSVSRVRKQDTSSVFSSIYSVSEKNAEFIIQFAQEHNEEITKYYNASNQIGKIISGALMKYPTKHLIDQVEKLINNQKPYVKSIKSMLEKSLENAKFELEWFENHSPAIINLLRAYKSRNENTTDYRLPGDVIPSAYNIILTPFLQQDNFTFNGVVNIIAEVTKATKKIVLHADQLKNFTVKVNELNGEQKIKELSVLKITNTEKYDFLNLHMTDILAAKTKISIEIAYTGYLNTEMRGFYRSSYKKDNVVRYLAVTHLEPVGARRVFPCFDEPALKATFSLSVIVPENYTAVSNTKVKTVKNNLYEFEKTPVMSTYLVALLVSDFSNQSKKDKDYEYTVLSNPLVIQQTNYSLEVMGPIVRFFNEKLGYRYALPKLDMVALPDFASGAMENWGLITYRETMMLYDPSSMSTLSSKQTIRNVIAHEIAHQWFGNLVSPHWWDYLWLNEGFARYFQYIAHTKIEDAWNLENQFVVDHLQISFADDASTSTHPITAKVYTPTEIRGIFDKISYAKAASVIRMLEKLIGSKKFYGALNRYLKARQSSTGTPEALFEAFEAELISENSINFNVTKVMNNWTRLPGFPVINVTIKGNEVTFSQKRFYLRPPENETRKSTWIVPINWATRSNPDFESVNKVEWLDKNESKITISKKNSDWIIFNLQQTGYYRVNYDEVAWRRIIAALNSKDRILIHEVNRASLIDDMLNLGRVGLLDYDLVLAGTRYLVDETEYIPWKAAFNGFSYLNKHFSNRPDIFPSYKEYLFQLLEPNFKRLKFDEVKGEKHTDTLLRKLTLDWLCYFGYKECTKEAAQLFHKQKKDSSFSIPPNKRSYAYCTGIREGTDEDWEYLWNRLKKSNYAAEQMTILTALGCSLNPANLNKLLNTAITPDLELNPIRFQDAEKAFKSVMSGSTVGIGVTLDFLNKNYENINKYFKDYGVIKSSISSISKRLTSDELVNKFDLVVKNLSEKIPSIAKSLQSSQKRANTERSWYNNRAPKIGDWLKRNKPESLMRLPTVAKPNSYDIYIRPYFEERNFTFDGNVTIDITIEKDTWMIGLNAKYLNIEDIKVEGKEIILDHKLDEASERLNIEFTQTLTAGSNLKLRIKYNGYLKDDMKGFYRSSYINDKGEKIWIASTQFEPTYARRAFPCFDEPSFKATFTVHIAKPTNYHTLSNMGSSPVQRNESNGEVWDHYKPSLKMSAYILAFTVTNFEKYVGSNQPSRVSVWARSQLKDYMSHAPDVGHQALGFLENLTNINYPLDEMNFVAVPDFDMGAMENWGLVTYREYGLAYGEAAIPATYKRYVTTTIAHELVHMWFGNLVTCEWWSYAWLNEGFADYLSYIAADSIEPSWQLLKQFVVEDLQNALAVDSSETSHPMNNKVVTPAEAKKTFDTITYAKAASVLRMFHHSLGKDVFIEALQIYLNNRKYDTAKPEHLIAAIKDRLKQKKIEPPDSLDVDIQIAIESWISQSGYPVINATRKDQNIVLSQERFLLQSNLTAKRRSYWTPITYTTETELNFDNTTPRLWLGGEEKTISVKPNDTWFILNVQEIGFYRVNYDVPTWKNLIKLLNSNDFTVINEVNRAQLIDDALNLARAGYLDFDIALNATKYLRKEPSHFAWKSYFDGISYIAQRFEGHKEINQFLSRYVLSLISNRYKTLGFKEDMKNDQHLEQLNRQLILSWACKYNHADCLEQTKEYFRQKNKAPVTPNIAVTVYCTAIAYGTSDNWNSLWNEYTTAILATDYLMMLKGLGCSRNATVLERYMDKIIAKDSKIRRQDVGTAFSSVYTSSSVGLETAINYFVKNLESLYNYYGNWNDVGSLFTSLAGRISTKEQLKRLEELSTEKNLTNIQSSLKSAVSTAKKNLNWFDQNSEKILTWLKAYNLENPEAPESEDDKGSAKGLMSLSFLTILYFALLVSYIA